MPWLSNNPLWETFASRALFSATYGGADFGECARALDRVGDGGADAWHREWSAQAHALVEAGDASAAAGHPLSAREAYLRATTYFRTAYMPLFGAPTNDRLRTTYTSECEAFTRAAPLWDTPVEVVEIPFEDGATLPGVLVCRDDTAQPRPTIVHVNGYDSNVHEMFVAHSGPALRRGYNVLLFDGPGQGRNLIRDGIPMRPDWENVVRPVLDYALERPEVDADRVVLAGWSWGGFLAPRGAAFEHRIAALWADPGQWDQRDRLPLEEHEKATFPDGADPERFVSMENHLRSDAGDPLMRWRLIQRGLWVHGVSTLFDYFAELARYELSSVAAEIACPALVTLAEDDPIAIGAPKLHAGIGAQRKTLISFSAAEGTGGHCEFEGRRRFHQRCFDWLDETLHQP
jgi:pimeloyl-ACP methyl ester carboxylesterase